MRSAFLPLLILVCADSVLAQSATGGSKPLDDLRASVQRTTSGVNAKWGVYIKSLETGEEVAVNADEPMESMSTIKIPLMVEVLEQVKARRFSLEDRYTLRSADKQEGTGTLQFMDPGATMSIRDLLTYMIVVSDNTATQVLYEKVGGKDVVNARMRSLGLSQTRAVMTPREWFGYSRDTSQVFWTAVEREWKAPFGVTTAREMGTLIERMERRTLVDSASSELMLQIMRNQVYRSRIPRHIFEWMPHKTGDWPPFIANDVGALEMPGNSVVLSIFTQLHQGALANLEDAIGLIALEARNYFLFRRAP